MLTYCLVSVGVLALFCSRNRWVLSALFVGVTLAFVAPYGQLAFMPALFSRKYGWSADQLAYVYGLIAIVAGVIWRVSYPAASMHASAGSTWPLSTISPSAVSSR